MIFCFDLDGVLFTIEGQYRPELVGRTSMECLRTLEWIRSRGHKVVIHTCRTNPGLNNWTGHSLVELVLFVKNHLDKAQIPYDDIAVFKPAAVWYFDDRANFTTWDKVKEKVEELENEH